VPGLGPATASKLVATFGADTLAVLSSPDAEARLAAVPGIGPRTATKLKKGWDDSANSRDTVSFLVRMGLNGRLAQLAVRQLGPKADESVRADPYAALAPLRGASFALADGVAASLGVSADAPSRVRSALREALLGKARRNGHVFLPWRDAASAALRLLHAPRSPATAAAAPAGSDEDFGGSQPFWGDDAARDGLPTPEHVYRAARELEAANELAIELPLLPPPPPPPPGEDGWAGAAMEQHRPEEEADNELHPASRLYLPHLLAAEKLVSLTLATAAAAGSGKLPANIEEWIDSNEQTLGIKLSKEQRQVVVSVANKRCGAPRRARTRAVQARPCARALTSLSHPRDAAS